MPGEQSVVLYSEERMLRWSVNNWRDSGEMVGALLTHLFIQYNFKCTLFNAGAVAVSVSRPGNGPIFLDQVVCSESDSSLLECGRRTPLGLVTCEHTHDALVRCIGKAQTNVDCSVMILVAFYFQISMSVTFPMEAVNRSVPILSVALPAAVE